MLQELLERKESKVSESEYVRELIRRDYSASIGIDPSDLVVIKRQLIGIGRNINQIAHCFNAGQYGVVDLSRLDQPLADVTAMKQAVEDMQIIFYNGCIKRGDDMAYLRLGCIKQASGHSMSIGLKRAIEYIYNPEKQMVRNILVAIIC